MHHRKALLAPTAILAAVVATRSVGAKKEEKKVRGLARQQQGKEHSSTKSPTSRAKVMAMRIPRIGKEVQATVVVTLPKKVKREGEDQGMEAKKKGETTTMTTGSGAPKRKKKRNQSWAYCNQSTPRGLETVRALINPEATAAATSAAMREWGVRVLETSRASRLRRLREVRVQTLLPLELEMTVLAIAAAQTVTRGQEV
jgi:hypothetical protein